MLTILPLLMVLATCMLSSAIQIPTIKLQLEEENGVHQVVCELAQQAAVKKMLNKVFNEVDKVQYEVVQPNRHFEVNRNSGQLTTSAVVDREALCSINLQQQLDQCAVEFVVKISSKTAALNQQQQFVRIVVEILDKNDHAPTFVKSDYQISIGEDVGVGFVENLPNAKDLDSIENGISNYKIVPCESEIINDTFTLHQQLSRDDSATATVKISLELMRSLDREERSTFVYCIAAIDKGQPPKSSTLTVHINVEDRNDHTPTWIANQKFTVDVRESTLPFKTIFQLQAMDQDPLFGLLRYSLDSRDEDSLNANYFVVNPESGEVQMRRFLDYEIRKRFLLPVLVQDNGQRSATATLTVNVLDDNDERPQIRFSPSSQVRIRENTDAQTLATITVLDRDSGDNGRVICTLQDQQRQYDEKFIFEFILQFGQEVMYELKSNQSFDREYKSKYHLFVSCKDHGTPPNIEKQDLTLIIEDENDNVPRFLLSSFEITVHEENMATHSITNLQAVDADSGKNGQLTYFVDSAAQAFVNIHRTSGELYSTIKYDRETRDLYTFNVTVRDCGTPPLESIITLTLRILDINDNAPYFHNKSYVFEVLENATLGTSVGQVAALDPDLGNNGTLYFRLKVTNAMQTFSVNNTGHIILVRHIDREKHEQLQLEVEAVDHGYPARSTQILVSIIVLDVNDSPPEFVNKRYLLHFNVTCDNAIVHHILASNELQAIDPDNKPINNQIVYNISKIVDARRAGRKKDGQRLHDFKIDAQSGQLFLSQVQEKEYCLTAEYMLTIIAFDPTKPSHFATKQVRVSFQAGKRSAWYGGIDEQRTRGGISSADNDDGKAQDHYGKNKHNGEDHTFREHNLLVIISLICASIIVAVILIVIILTLRRRGVNFGYKKGSVIVTQFNGGKQVANDTSTSISNSQPHKQTKQMETIIKSSTDDELLPPNDKQIMSDDITVVKTASSLDNIYFEHDVKQNYEKIKWLTCQQQKKLQKSYSNLSGGLGCQTSKPLSRLESQNSTESYNTYQSLGLASHEEHISRNKDACVDSYMTYQIRNQSVRPNDFSCNVNALKAGLSNKWLPTNINHSPINQTKITELNLCKSHLTARNEDNVRGIDSNKKLDTDDSNILKNSYFTISFV